jgi:Zn-dependent membrane protease YugP
MSGAEIAEKMLADNGIRDVRVISTPGQFNGSLQSSENRKFKRVGLQSA